MSELEWQVSKQKACSSSLTMLRCCGSNLHTVLIKMLKNMFETQLMMSPESFDGVQRRLSHNVVSVISNMTGIYFLILEETLKVVMITFYLSNSSNLKCLHICKGF